MKFNKYKFRKYEKNYPKIFEKEKEKLKNIILSSKIEHIGSTSVFGLGGKGVIDILVAVPKKNLDNVKDILIHSKYIFSKTGGNQQRAFFEKEYGFFKKIKIHIQLTFFDSKTYKEAIKFRDSLRKNKLLRERYSDIKKNAILLNKKNNDYREFKEKFIKEVINKK